MKKFFKEFKEFAMRGNVVDMAVGIIIGAAFKAIVDSLIANFIQPLLDAILPAPADAVEGAWAAGPAKNIKKKEEPAAEPTTKVCPFCQTEISIKATRCPHCTSELK